MKQRPIKRIVILFIAGLAMVLPYNPFCSHCQQNEQYVTVFYTHDLQGTLEPCG
jgi:hypothetical protein